MSLQFTNRVFVRKKPLTNVLGKAFLSYTELMTVLTDIEAIINSLPLTYVGDDIRERRIITPALLAMGIKKST